MDIFEEEKILDNVKEVSKYLEAKLQELTDKKDVIESRRGKGFMQGLVLKCPPGEILNKALDKGLVVISAGGNVLRMLPPLVITKEHVDEMYKILDEIME